MRYDVTWDVRAIDAAAGFLADDAQALDDVLRRVDQLGVDPRPAEAVPWGQVPLRLRVGRYRVTYAVDDMARMVDVVRIGRLAS